MATIEPFLWQEPLIQKITDSLTKYRFVINGCTTGSGKTILALESAKRLGNPLLCVVPKVSVTQWRRTAEAMDCVHIIHDIVTAQSLITAKNGAHYHPVKAKKGEPPIGKWTIPPNMTCCWDEPHKTASGDKSQATYAMAALRAYGARLHAMSATIADSPLKLRAAGYFGQLHQFAPPFFYPWAARNGCHYEDQNGKRVMVFTKDAALAKAFMEKIRRDFGDMFISIKPSEIPGFPEMSLDVQLVDLDARDRREIDKAILEMSERLKAKAKSALAERGRELERIEHALACAIAELTAASVLEGNSVVVGWHHTEPRVRFERELAKLGVLNVASVYGGQKDAERWAGIDRFQANLDHVMSVAVQAGGASLSLHDVLKVRPRESFFIPGDDAAGVKQFLGRIVRCEGTFARQHLVLAAGTLQEKVAVSLNRKIANIDALNTEPLADLTDADLMP